MTESRRPSGKRMWDRSTPSRVNPAFSATRWDATLSGCVVSSSRWTPPSVTAHSASSLVARVPGGDPAAGVTLAIGLRKAWNETRELLVLTGVDHRRHVGVSRRPQQQLAVAQFHRAIVRDKKGSESGTPSLRIIRRRPTLPGGCPPSTIGAGGLNFSVRNGKRCTPAAMTAENCQGAMRTLKTP